MADIVRQVMARLGEVRSRWTSIVLSTQPTDRQGSEEAFKKAYKSAGLKAPEKIVWVSSPYAGGLVYRLLTDPRFASKPEPSVGERIKIVPLESALEKKQLEFRVAFDDAAADLERTMKPLLWEPVGDKMVQVLRASILRTVPSAAARSIWAGVEKALQGNPKVRPTAWKQKNQVLNSVKGSFGTDVWLAHQLKVSQHRDISKIAVYDLLMSEFGVNCDSVEGLIDSARYCGWWWPLEKTVIATEHPIELRRDTRARLHDESQPAIRYADGWSVFAVRGVPVPCRVITEPARLNVKQIVCEDNLEVRRVMIERFGYKRFIADYKAKVIDSDSRGSLYQCPLPGEQPLVVLRVENPEPDGSRRTFFLRVPSDTSTVAQALTRIPQPGGA
jgi:hypothetical protein